MTKEFWQAEKYKETSFLDAHKVLCCAHYPFPIPSFVPESFDPEAVVEVSYKNCYVNQFIWFTEVTVCRITWAYCPECKTFFHTSEVTLRGADFPQSMAERSIF